MTGLLLWVHVLALAVWLGETVFFSFVVAPRLFSALPTEQAGAVVALLFPLYYAVGGACGVLVTATAGLLWRRGGANARGWLAAMLIAAVGLAAVLVAGLLVQPRASALRAARLQPDAPATVQADFSALHRSAMQLNGVVLVAALGLSGLLAAQLAGAARGARRSAFLP
jgi:uncharacterized membrane protein